MEIKDVAARCLSRAESLLSEWLPNGERKGREYTCGSLGGNKGKSLSINIDTGAWADFNTGEKGGDLVSLYAAINGLKQLEAAKKLSTDPDTKHSAPAVTKKKPKITPKPVPRGTPLPDMAYNGHGDPVDHYEYLNNEGHILFMVARYEQSGKKHFTPFTHTDDGWVTKLPTDIKRPLFNLDKVQAAKNILIVEGEKAAIAATKIVSPTYQVVTWHGGASSVSKTDWSPLKDKTALIWPDADEAGEKAAYEIADILAGLTNETKILAVDDIKIKGWDAADALSDGMDWAKFKAWAKPRVEVYDPPAHDIPDVTEDLEAPPIDDTPMPDKSETLPDKQNTTKRMAFSYTDEQGKIRRMPALLYDYLRSRHDATYIYDFSSFAIWDGKKYTFQPDVYIKNYAQTHYYPTLTVITERQTFYEYAKTANFAPMSDYSLRDSGFVNFQNGVLNIETGELLPHDPKYKMSTLLPASYTPGPCPVWDELMLRITLSRPHLQTVIEEFVGYILSACDYNKLNKFLIFDGAGANGKSTVVRIITDLIGVNNTSAVRLEDIGNNQFAASGLFNKLLNVCNESPVRCFSDTGPLKALTGGDAISVEEKYKGAIQYTNLAKFIISYNEAPYLNDASPGFRRRPIIVPFEQDFEENPELKIKNPEFKIRQTERDHLAHRCINAFMQVLKRGHFTPIPESSAKIEEMLVNSDKVRLFVNECLTVDRTNDTNFLAASTLFERFKEYDEGAGRYSLSKLAFFRKFTRTTGLNSSVKRIGLTTERVYFGVCFKDGVL